MTNRDSPRPVPIWCVVALVAVVVGTTASVLGEGGITAIDQPGTDWVVQRRDGVVTPIAIAISAVGGTLPMAALAVVMCLTLAWSGRWPEAGLAGFATAGSGILVVVGKHLVGRTRPPEADRLVTATNPAFPSGHSLGSIVVIGVLAVVVLSRLQRPAARRTAMTTASVFVVAVGLSRWYLGVHWPTDILGGWCIGALWLALCLAAYRYLVTKAGVVQVASETLGMQTPAASDSSSAPPTSAATAIAPNTSTHSSAGKWVSRAS